jgi:hypothetical protein
MAAFLPRSPAQAGAYLSAVSASEEWVPAFAGKRESFVTCR